MKKKNIFIGQFSVAHTLKKNTFVTPVAKNLVDKLDRCLVPKCSEFQLKWRRVVSFPNFSQKVNLIFDFRQKHRLFQDPGDVLLHNPEDAASPSSIR